MAVAAIGLNAQTPDDYATGFSADITTQTTLSDGTSSVRQSKVYYGKNKMRVDMINSADTGLKHGQGIGGMIYRMDQRVSWMLIPDKKTYIEMPIAAMPMNGAAPVNPLEMPDKKYIAAESVNGELANKYEVTMGNGDAAQTLYVWIANKSMIPLRVETTTPGGSLTIEYTNVVPGEPAAELFEIPSGYTKFEIKGIPRMH